MRSLPHLGAAVGLLCLMIGFAAPFDGLAADAQHALGLALFAVVFWTAQPVPVEYSSLLVLLLLLQHLHLLREHLHLEHLHLKHLHLEHLQLRLLLLMLRLE